MNILTTKNFCLLLWPLIVQSIIYAEIYTIYKTFILSNVIEHSLWINLFSWLIPCFIMDQTAFIPFSILCLTAKLTHLIVDQNLKVIFYLEVQFASCVVPVFYVWKSWNYFKLKLIVFYYTEGAELLLQFRVRGFRGFRGSAEAQKTSLW